VAETFEVDALKAQDGIRTIIEQLGDPERSIAWRRRSGVAA
jgi:hypothetical protein